VIQVNDQAAGLILSGGGARAAYQVGVLRAIANMLRRRSPNPFGIMCGTSAGAINAASLAGNADRFDRAVAHLARTWGNPHWDQVYRADVVGVLQILSRCLAVLLAGGLSRPQPVSLHDSTPLVELLRRTIDFSRIRQTIAAGHLQALCITASSYTSGDPISFFQGEDSYEPWQRARRIGRPAQIGLPHVLASCALPFAFPVVRIDREHFGDGSMHQLAPISPALHLGARRVLVIGVGSALPRERIAARPGALPRAMRLLMRRAGVFGPGGARVLSYLLFERGYCRHLMRLGFSDAMVQRPRILEFLGYGSVPGRSGYMERATA
jgi:NTE family protein